MRPHHSIPELPPTDLFQLVGHPLRWLLLGELARSDRTVHELTGLLLQPQNLVSYHLGKLRDAGLVTMQQSSADRRDSYYAIDLTRLGKLLSNAAVLLHPGLHPPPPPVLPVVSMPKRVLFLCTGNSARSQIAEALVRVHSRDAVEAFSAGSSPKPLHPNACKVMREEHGIDLSSHTSKHLSEFVGDRFDVVVSLCDRVREICLEIITEFKGEPTRIHWSIRNPANDALADEISYPVFQQVAAELQIRIGFLLAVLADQAHTDAREKT